MHSHIATVPSKEANANASGDKTGAKSTKQTVHLWTPAVVDSSFHSLSLFNFQIHAHGSGAPQQEANHPPHLEKQHCQAG